jgi:transcriptional regulator with XRE-family HTH domain
VAENPDLLLNQIGLRVARRRQEFGLTQQGLAERLGITTTNVSRIENAQQNLTIRTLCKLAEALDVTVEELIAARPGSG